ncbi:MAG: cytochrome c oxidase assembly protein [Alphaproteobacteria bacterium]|nr:cytochrome c oxidase assembly protein [Alphaproteobacteria bacterium]
MRARRSSTLLGLSLVAVIAGMVGLTFAAVPLYRVFCAVTGYGGTPQIGAALSRTVSANTITVRFDAAVNPGLPWQFKPEQGQVTFRLGEQQVAFYRARNTSDQPVRGIAVYNVTPEKVGRYFHKTACFCFNEQTLSPNQEMQLPVSFWVDPAIADDPSTADVTVITLSYTFFRSLDDAAKSGALANAGPHVGPLIR